MDVLVNEKHDDGQPILETICTGSKPNVVISEASHVFRVTMKLFLDLSSTCPLGATCFSRVLLRPLFVSIYMYPCCQIKLAAFKTLVLSFIFPTVSGFFSDNVRSPSDRLHPHFNYVREALVISRLLTVNFHFVVFNV